MALPSPKSLLGRFGLTPKHSFGQNFLADAQLARKIATLAAPTEACLVLELGAGLGALTDELLERGNSVIAIERDRDLVPALQELFAEGIAEGRLRVVEADAKAADWEDLLFGELSCQGEHSEAPRVIAGNLPYQITGPLLERTVSFGDHVERAVFLVQKEVAERLAAKPGIKAYGALSVFVQARFHVTRALVLKAGAFYPPPRVDSAVVVLERRDNAIEETPEFRRVVKLAFAARRKTLRNAWKTLAPREVLDAIAADVGFELEQRGETLTVADFGAVAERLRSPGHGGA